LRQHDHDRVRSQGPRDHARGHPATRTEYAVKPTSIWA
jgi:hypothetical protein